MLHFRRLITTRSRDARRCGWAALLLMLGVGCTGTIAFPGSPEGSRSGTTGAGTSSVPTGNPVWDQAPGPGLRRLSRREVERALDDVFGRAGLAEAYLPPDVFEPFDTDVTTKEPSAVFIEGMHALAYALAEDKSADAAWIQDVAGCTPSGAADADCLRGFTTELGRRLWRRPLQDAEVTTIASTGLDFANETSDFALGARLVIQALVQSPEFIYRTEIGEADGALRRLDNYELVTRLSFLVWGTTPDTALLDRAEGAPFSDTDLTELAEGMLTDPRAVPQMATFHEQWLGYQGLRVPASLRDSMLQETTALIDRVLADDNTRWSELFTSRATFIDSDLAAHYGMTSPVTEANWVSYEHPQRAGLLSHGSILSLSARDTDDTSPTIRGHYVATRLLCRAIPPPPPDVDVDDPPVPDADTCKYEAYEAHRVPGSACYACHQLMDPIGFGLERFDGLGRYRDVEKQSAACAITGDGELVGDGTFNGPRELASLMTQGTELRSCAVDQFARFATGRAQGTEDAGALSRVMDRFAASGESFRALVLGLVSDPTFRYRVEEEP